MKKDSRFTFLHTHTTNSLLDGIIKIPEYVQHIKSLGLSSAAITDHGTLSGVIDFYKECRKQDIRPLLGIEAYVTSDEDMSENKNKDNLHLVLIAKTTEGLRRLFELASDAALRNFYYKPRINFEKLKYLRGHVVATSACLKGALSEFIEYEIDSVGQVQGASDRLQLTEKRLDLLLSSFGEDFFIELQDWDDGTGLNIAYNKFLIELGKRRGVPFVITTDAHYLRKEDHEAHERAIAIQLKMTIDEYREQDSMRYGPHFYIKTPEEMLQSAIKLGCEEAYSNTALIASKCNVEIILGQLKFPNFKIEDDKDYQEFISEKDK